MSKVSYIPKDYNSVTPTWSYRAAAQALSTTRKFFGAPKSFA